MVGRSAAMRRRGQDRDGASRHMRHSRCRCPFVKLAFKDNRVTHVTAIPVEIVREPKDQVGFAVHARR